MMGKRSRSAYRGILEWPVGGMGDVLTGIIVALLAQKIPLADAAKLGVWLHSSAADLNTKSHGQRGLLASDLLPHLRELLN